MTNMWKFEILIIIFNSAFIDLLSPSNIMNSHCLLCICLLLQMKSQQIYYFFKIFLHFFIVLMYFQEGWWNDDVIWHHMKKRKVIHYTWNTSHMYQYINNLWVICSLHGNEVPCSLFIYSCNKSPVVWVLHLIRIMNIRISLLILQLP